MKCCRLPVRRATGYRLRFRPVLTVSCPALPAASVLAASWSWS